ncbi:Holliday junction resolvase RecU [Mycoplasma elephantis]|uniref:Holliday junction resolvase RecU n=1 Tax=Mycoplasma elephantis TaxID=114882 RepID=UPI00068F6FED|nr:Holliday junction resolvase RecU [Mycoplasma elephantis]
MINKNNGKFLEHLINQSISYYKLNDIALVHRVYLDISFLRVKDKLNLEKAKICTKSTVDYYGLYKGKFFAFDAKSTIKDYFDLSFIKKHQHDYLCDVIKHNGIGFYIIGFLNMNKYYWISAEKLIFR